MRKDKKVLIGIVLSILTILVLNVKVFAFDISINENYTDSYIEWSNLDEEERNRTIMPVPYAIDYVQELEESENKPLYLLKLKAATSYNLKNKIGLVVKNQQDTNQCWAFSANTVLETNLALRNSEILDFSERYLAYASSITFSDGTNSKGYNKEVSEGGLMNMALSFYLSGEGPILEKEMPFENNESKISLSEIENKTTVKKIESYTLFPGIFKTRSGNTLYYTNGESKIYTTDEVNSMRNSIKDHIVKYGGVSAAIYATSDYGKSHYYNGYEISNHQVTIVGWDDNYAVSNFTGSEVPVNPGAYIILNSWGTTYGENGYAYISYDDVHIEESIYGVKDIINIDYDKIYQYDPYGLIADIWRGTAKTIYGANVFSRDTSKNEKLQEVGISSFTNTSCEIYINPKGDGLASKDLTKVATATLTPGYQTIKLSTPVTLTGNKFAIVVKYTSISADPATIAVEAKISENKYYDFATSEPGQSYTSLDMNTWEDLTVQLENVNICIKAFTKEFVPPKDDVSSSIYGVNLDSNYINKIPTKTTVSTLLSKLTCEAKLTVYNKAGQEISGTTLVGTGGTLKADGNRTYSISVVGDINGDGKVGVEDLLAVKRQILSTNKSEWKLTGMQFISADINYDNNVNVVDLLEVKRMVLSNL